MADYQLSYTGDQVNTAIGQIINKNITGTLTIETLDLTNSLVITQGGTGATTAGAARENLGIKSCGTYDILPIVKGGTGQTTATEALKNLGGVSLVKLWENASPSSAFPPQDVTITTVNAGDLIGIEFESQSRELNRRITWLGVKSGTTTEIVTVQSTSDGGEVFVTRRGVTIVSSSLIRFGAGYYRYVTSTNNRHDGYSVPTAIYAVEGVV